MNDVVWALVLAVALWPMTFVYRTWRHTFWMASVAGLLSAFFVANAFRHPDQWAFNLLFAMLASVASVRAVKGAIGKDRPDL